MESLKDENQFCVYKTNDNLCCAVGFHIQSILTEEMDQCMVDELISNFPEVREKLNIKQKNSFINYSDFWRGMQLAHDTSKTLEQINNKLEDLAKKFNITPKQLTRWSL